jgi:TonB family protein
VSRSADAAGARAPRNARTQGHLGRGALAALLTHVHLLAPFIIATFIYAAREEAQRAEEMDVGFENVPAEELPQDLPPLDDTPEPLAKAPSEREKADRRPPDKKTEAKKRDEELRKPEEAQAEKKPEPEIVVPPLPPMPPQPPPPQPKSHEKIVDLDNDKDVEPPPDAKYLAQKNNRAEVETRDTQTNLERNQKGEQGGQQNPENERQDDDHPGDDKAKVAELEDVKSKLGRQAPEVTPSKETEAPQPRQADNAKPPSPVLSLRDASPRGHEITPETVDPSLPHDPAGMLARAKPRGVFRDSEARDPDSGGKRLKLTLSGKDYEYLFGAEAKAERQLAQRERSTQLGKRGQRLARIRSSLENFISEVKPGNQTALNTRAAPFAAFIARMHRNIHKLWGYGALEDWDDLPPNSPFNDDTLATVVEIVLNRDGTVDKVSIVRPSRYLAYDAAAIDTVYSAGPYPEPPREIRSKNGKIYVHWSFFRDARQCATTGVDYFILNNAPQGGDAGDGEDPAPAAAPASEGAPEGPRRLERNLAEAPARPGAGTKWWGNTGKQHVHSEDEESQSAAGESAPEPARPDEGGAAAAARAWMGAFARGDVQAMTHGARYPFRSTQGVTANGPEELGRMLRSLIAESARRVGDNVKVETAAGLRKQLGKLPPGMDDGSGMLFGITEIDGDTMILLMAKTPHGWKVAGLVRR